MSAVRECPRCRARYQGAEDFCGTDGTRLVDVPAERPGEGEAGDPAGLIGQTLGGRFLLTELLGKSDAALVFRANHKVLERDFAVKLLLKAARRDRRALQRFLREAKVASSVDHPNIVTIYDFGHSEAGDPYIVMEYVDGVPLRQVIAASPGGRLPTPQALDLILQVGRALEHAHGRGVVHRNIKPDNVALVHRDGHADFVKVLDLGVARLVGQPGLTQKGEIIGTAEFIAPEAWSEEATEVAPPMDLYALGVLLHCAIAGRPPFVGERGEIMLAHLHSAPPSLSSHSGDREVPRELDALTARLLDKDPAQRPSAAEAVGALEQIQAQLPPPSLQSLLLQKTLILPPRPAPERPRWQQATMLTDRAERQTVVRLPTDEQRRPPSIAATLTQIDALEAELERTWRRLADGTDALGRRLWPVRWPPEPEELAAHIRALEETEETFGIQLAVLEERLRQREQEVQERRAELRRRILALSERLRGAPDVNTSSGRILLEASGPVPAPLSPEERAEVQAQLMEAERAYAAAGQEGDGGIRDERAEAREQLQAVRTDLRESRTRLARLVCVAAAAQAELAAERRRLEQLLDQIEAAGKTLARLLLQAQRQP